MDSYDNRSQRLIFYCNVLERAEALEKSVMKECGFIMGEENDFLYSDERAALTDFFSFLNSETPIGIIHTLMQGKLIGDLIVNLKNHLITIGGISEDQKRRLDEAYITRMEVYESIAYMSL